MSPGTTPQPTAPDGEVGHSASRSGDEGAPWPGPQTLSLARTHWPGLRLSPWEEALNLPEDKHPCAGPQQPGDVPPGSLMGSEKAPCT